MATGEPSYRKLHCGNFLPAPKGVQGLLNSRGPLHTNHPLFSCGIIQPKFRLLFTIRPLRYRPFHSSFQLVLGAPRLSVCLPASHSLCQYHRMVWWIMCSSDKTSWYTMCMNISLLCSCILGYSLLSLS
jgi:hypothetical protein